MIKVQGKIPRKIYVACSGGVDSMAALDFLRRNHDVIVLYFDHKTPHSREAQLFLLKYSQEHKISFVTDAIRGECPQGASKEAWWREERYRFFDWFSEEGRPWARTVVTCHHLDDCVETWVWSCMHGTGKVVPYARSNIIRPFRLTRKRDFEMWANLNNVPYVQDPSNADTAFMRNYIRHEMMPHVLQVNPGIHKTVAKKVIKSFEQDIDTPQD